MNNLTKIKKDIRSFWDAKGFIEWEPAGVCPSIQKYPIFKTTFNPSASHVQIYSLLTNREKISFGDYYIIEKVYRHNDTGFVGDKTHLSFFNMLGTVKLLSPDITTKQLYIERENFFNTIIDFIKMYISDSNKLSFSFFDGGVIFDEPLERDNDFFSILRNSKVDTINTYGLKGTYSFLYPKSSFNPENPLNDTAGYRNDVFCSTQNNELVEISTIDFLEYITTNTVLKKNDKFYMLGFFTGLERLLSCKNNYNLWEIGCFDDILNDLSNYLYIHYDYFENEFFKRIILNELKIFVDRLRSSLNIISEGQTTGNSDRGHMLQKIIKDIIRFMDNYLGRFDISFLEFAIEKIKTIDEVLLDNLEIIQVIEDFYKRRLIFLKNG